MPPAKKRKQEEKDEPIQIISVKRQMARFHVLGRTGFMSNCLSYKNKCELLFPRGRLTEADKKVILKHNVPQEYRDSIYYSQDDKNPTYIQMVSTAFKKAMISAGKDMPKVNGTTIGRLTFVELERVNMFGRPVMDIRMVRQAGASNAPDMRIRCFQPEWACQIDVSYVTPQFNANSIANLLAAAGVYIGIGDGRNEKGALSFGLFDLVSPDNPDYVRITTEQGRDVQAEGLENFEFNNEETERLYYWWADELERRKSGPPMQPPAKKAKKGKKTPKGNGVEAEQ